MNMLLKKKRSVFRSIYELQRASIFNKLSKTIENLAFYRLINSGKSTQQKLTGNSKKQ